MPEGTVIEVTDLFFNVPARRKFLKSDGAESTQASRAVTQLALAYPGVGFTLTSGSAKALALCSGPEPGRALSSAVRGPPGPRRSPQDGGWRFGARLRRRPDGPRTGAWPAERLCQRSGGQRPDGCARHTRGLQPRDCEGQNARGAPVYRTFRQTVSMSTCIRRKPKCVFSSNPHPRVVAACAWRRAGPAKLRAPVPRRAQGWLCVCADAAVDSWHRRRDDGPKPLGRCHRRLRA